jgi:hypothetical protein
LFLAVVIDLFSRVVGWSMRPDMHRSLVIDALEMGLFQRRPPKGRMIFHSDRGSQYASNDFRDVLDNHGVLPSMSRKGNCWDNAVTETLFGSLKVERLHGLTTCASLCADFGLDTVNVNAATAAPAVILTPTSLAFASTLVGSTTAAKVVTIKNSGTATLNLTSETITGTNPTSFIKSATTCGTTLAAAASCTVSVEFKPAATGALKASLSLVDNATGSPQAVALAGTGN